MQRANFPLDNLSGSELFVTLNPEYVFWITPGNASVTIEMIYVQHLMYACWHKSCSVSLILLYISYTICECTYSYATLCHSEGWIFQMY